MYQNRAFSRITLQQSFMFHYIFDQFPPIYNQRKTFTIVIEIGKMRRVCQKQIVRYCFFKNVLFLLSKILILMITLFYCSFEFGLFRSKLPHQTQHSNILNRTLNFYQIIIQLQIFRITKSNFIKIDDQFDRFSRTCICKQSIKFFGGDVTDKECSCCDFRSDFYEKNKQTNKQRVIHKQKNSFKLVRILLY